MKLCWSVLLSGACALALAPVVSAADIVDTAVQGKFNTLVAAVKAAGLVVFAPTDEPFAKLPAGALEDLLKPENKSKLQSVLKYHVLSGKVTARDVVRLTSGKTVGGGSLNSKPVAGTSW